MRIDYKAMTEYAKSIGKRPSTLTSEEKAKFINK